jgi:hypothetical protein
MISYIVRCQFGGGSENPRELSVRWLNWLRDEHLEDVMDGGAESVEVFEMDENQPTFEIRYVFPSREIFVAYEKDQAPRLRAEGLRLFPLEQGLKYERRVGESVLGKGASRLEESRGMVKDAIPVATAIGGEAVANGSTTAQKTPQEITVRYLTALLVLVIAAFVLFCFQATVIAVQGSMEYFVGSEQTFFHFASAFFVVGCCFSFVAVTSRHLKTASIAMAVLVPCVLLAIFLLVLANAFRYGFKIFDNKSVFLLLCDGIVVALALAMVARVFLRLEMTHRDAEPVEFRNGTRQLIIAALLLVAPIGVTYLWAFVKGGSDFQAQYDVLEMALPAAITYLATAAYFVGVILPVGLCVLGKRWLGIRIALLVLLGLIAGAISAFTIWLAYTQTHGTSASYLYVEPDFWTRAFWVLGGFVRWFTIFGFPLLVFLILYWFGFRVFRLKDAQVRPVEEAYVDPLA